MEPHKRQLHITMAHQYPHEHHAELETMAQALVDPSLPAKWELRLYSRDVRLAASEVNTYCSAGAHVHVHVYMVQCAPGY